MRDLNAKGGLNNLQAKFFSSQKEKEELYNLKNDPFETTNLANNPKYKRQLAKMRGYYNDWNEKNTDQGFKEIIWKNAPPPNAPEIIEWLKVERPEVIEQMKQGIEPGFSKLVKAYKTYNRQQNK